MYPGAAWPQDWQAILYGICGSKRAKAPVRVDLIQVRFKNILLPASRPHKEPSRVDQPIDQFQNVFQVTGKLIPCHTSHATPTLILTLNPWCTHREKFSWLAHKTALKEELDRLESLQIVTPVSEPTPWASSMVIVKTPNGNIGVCLDRKGLKQASRRNHYPTPTIDSWDVPKVWVRWTSKMDSGRLS